MRLGGDAKSKDVQAVKIGCEGLNSRIDDLEVQIDQTNRLFMRIGNLSAKIERRQYKGLDAMETVGKSGKMDGDALYVMPSIMATFDTDRAS
jgi:hypothetical protein